MATHSSMLAWRIPLIGEPGRLQSMGQQRVGHSWGNLVETDMNTSRGQLSRTQEFSPPFFLSFNMHIFQTKKVGFGSRDQICGSQFFHRLQ